MKRVALSALITLSAVLLADEGKEEISSLTLDASDKPIVQETKGLVLVGNDQDMNQRKFAQIRGLEAYNLNVPGSFNELKARLEPLFLNKPLTQELLVLLKKEILSYYSDYHRPLLLVEIPEQNVTSGVVQLIITESRLGQVICKGNTHFTCGQLKRYIRIRPGEEIASDTLLSEVAFMNRNYFRRTNIAFVPGQERKTTDLVLLTKDRMPWRFYTGGDNTGNKFSGEARWFAGFNWGNVFGWDHTFSYQYTTSSDFHEFQSHTFHYTAPTKYHHTVVAYGGFSHVKPSLSSLNDDIRPAGGHLRAKGYSSQVSGRYQIPVGTTWESNLLEFILGFDYKHMNNNLEFVGDNTIPIVFKSANLTQFVGGLTYGLETKKHKFSYETEAFWSPGQLMGGGSNTAFNNIRNRAKNHYIYGRLSLGETYHMPKGWDFYFLLRGQAANRVLLPSEQFGLGGYNTVRGYAEREFNADNAVLGTVEFHCPSFSLFRMGKKDHRKDRLTFLVFGDYAHGWNYKSLYNERRSDWLASVGPGLRFNIDRYLTTRVDWGFKLHKDDAIGNHYGKVNLSVIASY